MTEQNLYQCAQELEASKDLKNDMADLKEKCLPAVKAFSRDDQ